MMRKILTLAAFVGLAASVAPNPLQAADPPKLEGSWEGTMKVNDAVSLRMVYHVKKADDGKLTATFESPDQGPGAIGVDTVKLDKGEVTLGITRIMGEFVGKFSDDGKTIVGTFKQAGMTFPLTLAPSKAKPAEPLGKPDSIWEGKLKINGGIQLRIVLNIYKGKDGKLTATMDSPDQGSKGIPVSTVKLDDTSLEFSVKGIGGSYKGKLNDAKTEAEGTWTQAGDLPLNLKKVDKTSEVRRTQVPKPPFPYKAEEVSFDNPEAHNTLAGTLTLPEGDGPFPVVILISGSGPQDRDETLLGHKPFLVLADAVTRRGVGVLRFDDRGVGKSTGDHSKATSADFATDVKAGIDYLKTRKDVDAKKIGLMGHSEGGLIAPMVAAAHPDDVAFLVLLAGPGVPGDEILTAQSALIMKAMGAGEDDIAKGLATSKKIYEAIRTEKDDAALSKTLAALAKEAYESLSEKERKELGANAKAQVDAQIKMVQSPWFRFFLRYDPRPTLAKVKCPVLAINGENDLQVPPKQSLPEIEKAIRSGGNEHVTIKELPGLNHLFQTSETGAPGDYGQIEETFSPKALEVIGDWLTDQK